MRFLVSLILQIVEGRRAQTSHKHGSPFYGRPSVW